MALRAASRRLIDSVPKEVVDDIYRCSFKKQTGVSLKYMLDFSSMPLERQMLLSAQFRGIPASTGLELLPAVPPPSVTQLVR